MAKSGQDTEEERTRLRTTFDRDALLYDRARPGYPAALFDDVVSLAGLPPGGRILEIGCGTGQATLPFARRGYRILCVEIGARPAAVARHNLAAYPQVEVRTGAFEAWPVEERAFDLAFAATAFHWLDPAVRFRKIAQALKPGGALALFSSADVQSDAGGDFWEEVQQIYRREAPEIVKDDGPLPRAGEVPIDTREIDRTDRFGPVAVRTYPWELAYDAESYIRLLSTYSGHIHLPDATRERLFHGIADLDRHALRRPHRQGLSDGPLPGSAGVRDVSSRLLAWPEPPSLAGSLYRWCNHSKPERLQWFGADR